MERRAISVSLLRYWRISLQLRTGTNARCLVARVAICRCSLVGVEAAVSRATSANYIIIMLCSAGRTNRQLCLCEPTDRSARSRLARGSCK